MAHAPYESIDPTVLGTHIDPSQPRAAAFSCPCRQDYCGRRPGVPKLPSPRRRAKLAAEFCCLIHERLSLRQLSLPDGSRVGLIYILSHCCQVENTTRVRVTPVLLATHTFRCRRRFRHRRRGEAESGDFPPRVAQRGSCGAPGRLCGRHVRNRCGRRATRRLARRAHRSRGRLPAGRMPAHYVAAGIVEDLGRALTHTSLGGE